MTIVWKEINKEPNFCCNSAVTAGGGVDAGGGIVVGDCFAEGRGWGVAAGLTCRSW